MKCTLAWILLGITFTISRLQSVRICVCHVDREAARLRCCSVREEFSLLLALCASLQVDCICGDLNSSIYKCFPKQALPSVWDSSIMSVARRLQDCLRLVHGADHPLPYVTYCHSTPSESAGIFARELRETMERYHDEGGPGSANEPWKNWTREKYAFISK